jgi:hypothetical protein
MCTPSSPCSGVRNLSEVRALGYGPASGPQEDLRLTFAQSFLLLVTPWRVASSRENDK